MALVLLMYLFRNGHLSTSPVWVFNNAAISCTLGCDNSNGANFGFSKTSWDYILHVLFTFA